MRFVDKVVMVTGAGGGIGESICRHFADEGALLVVTDIDLAAANKVANEVAPKKSLVLKLDVTDPTSVDEAVAKAIQSFGHIDVLVNCAGVSTMHLVVDMSVEEWDFNFNVNAKGVFLVSKAVAKTMIARGRGGKIVSIASMAGKLAAPYLVHYSASKFAVVGFTQGLALELAKYKINVNCVCPAFVKTAMQDREVQWEAELRGITPEEVRANYVRMTPLGRLETPDDVAKVVLFLASPDADFMTGQAINVTGGALLH
ncbi:MAG: SDR family oxidoreductase [Firmicutes bacterium]|nr:SDR family oxidoreductase [Bacillota bacterium]